MSVIQFDEDTYHVLVKNQQLYINGQLQPEAVRHKFKKLGCQVSIDMEISLWKDTIPPKVKKLLESLELKDVDAFVRETEARRAPPTEDSIWHHQ